MEQAEQSVEAVRSGTILAHDKKAYQRWRSGQASVHRAKGRGLTGVALEQAVLRIGRLFPGNVLRGTA